MGLMMRHMNEIARTLHENPEHYEPLIQENPNDGNPIPVIDEWCVGFMKGVSLDPSGWLPVTMGHPDWLCTVIRRRAAADRGAPDLDVAHAAFLERRPPIAGEHTDEVLQEIGYTRAAIDDLRARGIVQLAALERHGGHE